MHKANLELLLNTFHQAGIDGIHLLVTGRFMLTKNVMIQSNFSSKFYNYEVSNQGQSEKHGSNYTEDYFTDRVCDQAVDFIKTSAKNSEKPFFMYVATPAPHRPATPAPQYANLFSDKVAPRTPSYGFAAPDKHWIITNGYILLFLYFMIVFVSGTPPLTPETTKVVDDLYRDRIRTLVSVDDLVEAIVNELKVKI